MKKLLELFLNILGAIIIVALTIYYLFFIEILPNGTAIFHNPF